MTITKAVEPVTGYVIKALKLPRNKTIDDAFERNNDFELFEDEYGYSCDIIQCDKYENITRMRKCCIFR